MSDALALLAAVASAYTVGSVPVGITLGRVLRGIDVRRYGSGSTGATNVLRTLGPGAGVAVLLLDWGKGAASVFIARALSDEPAVTAAAGVAAVVGHAWPVFAGFKGGKSVATGLGALTIISPLGAVFAALGLVVAAVTRYVSLGSMVGTATGLVTLVVLVALDRLDTAYLIFAVGGFVIIEARHWANLVRLLRGTENRFEGFARPKRVRDPRPERASTSP
jgi:glycerol-3-phosphate acyltransferase PlsY